MLFESIFHDSVCLINTQPLIRPATGVLRPCKESCFFLPSPIYIAMGKAFEVEYCIQVFGQLELL